MERVGAAEAQSRKYILSAPASARIIHSEHGEVIVPCRSKLTALLCAAEIWGCDWTDFREAQVLAIENHERSKAD